MSLEKFLIDLAGKLHSIDRRTMGRFPEIKKAIVFINKERSIRNTQSVRKTRRRLR